MLGKVAHNKVIVEWTETLFLKTRRLIPYIFFIVSDFYVEKERKMERKNVNQGLTL